MRALEVLGVSTRLEVTSFGGPVAHLGYYRAEFVERRRWLDELGTVMRPHPNGVAGAALALVAMFLPGFLLVIGALPFWNGLRRRPAFQSALTGVNAAVVGLLLAAFYGPVWTSAIGGPADFALALVAFALLALWALPPWLVVVIAAAGGGLVGGR